MPSNHSREDIAGLEPTTGGYISSWNTSARRGTMNEIGSMYESFTVLKARITSFSCVLMPRLGRNATPLWGSADLYSDKNSNLSCAYSKYRILPSLFMSVSTPLPQPEDEL